MSRTAVTISESASVALISPSVLKTVLLPTCSPGKIIHIADSTGQASNMPIWISSAGTGITIVGSPVGPGNLPIINRNYGSMTFLAGNGGNTWFTLMNEGGNTAFTSLSTTNATITNLTVTGSVSFPQMFKMCSLGMTNGLVTGTSPWTPIYPQIAITISSGSFLTAMPDLNTYRVDEGGIFSISMYTGSQFADYVDSTAWVDVLDSSSNLVIRSPAAASARFGAGGITWTCSVTSMSFFEFGFSFSDTSLTISETNNKYTNWTVQKIS